jgi:glutathione S-transferase
MRDKIALNNNSFILLEITFWHYTIKNHGDEYDKLIYDTIPFYLNKLNARAKNGHLALEDRETWADIFSIAVIDYCNSLLKFNILDGYDELMKVYEKVRSFPGIQKYLATRPEDIIPAFEN